MTELDSSLDEADGAAGRNETDALTETRRGLRDLAALLALPAMWVDHDPDDIAKGLVGVLFTVLSLECAYVRIDDPAGKPAIEHWRPNGPQRPSAFASALALYHERGAVTTTVTTPSDDGVVRVTSMPLFFPRVEGLILVGARQTRFPTENDLHLLRVAVGQAAIAIHTARRLADEQAARLAAEDALHRRNAFLANLVRSLELPLASLEEQVEKVRAFSTELDHHGARRIDHFDSGPSPIDTPELLEPN